MKYLDEQIGKSEQLQTPTLEQVKEYFKNAKEVFGVDNTYATFKFQDERGIHEHNNSFWVFAENGNCLLWSFNSKKYAKIISCKDKLETPKHYDNSKGTLYKVATERNWNPYLFDIVKRLERAEKKGEFKTDLEKSINVIKLWLQEHDS
jgi:hypothetical protein